MKNLSIAKKVTIPVAVLAIAIMINFVGTFIEVTRISRLSENLCKQVKRLRILHK